MASANVRMVTDASFKNEVLDSSVPVLLDFTAVWCGPCRAIAPLLDQLADQNLGKIKVVKMDVDENPEIPNQFRVQNIPMLLLFKDGKEVNRHVGSLRKPDLDKFVAKVL